MTSIRTGAGGDVPLNADIAMSLRYYAGYIQDTWRVNNRVTFVLGLRYETQRPATERFNRLSFFDPNVTNPFGSRVGLNLKGGFRFVNADDRGAWEADNTDLAPRVGLALKRASRNTNGYRLRTK